MRKLLAILVVFVVVLALAETVTLQLKWFNQFQFAGFYVAKEKGFYSEEGLNVIIKQGGPTVSPLKEILEGRAQFAIAGPDIIQYVSKRVPVKAIMTVFQQSPTCLMTLEKSGIKSPKDFKGKTVGILNDYTYIELKLILKKAGLSIRDIRKVRWTFDLKGFVSGNYDVVPAYRTNEPDIVRSMGYEVRLFYPENYGIHFVGDVLFVKSDLLKNNRDLVKRFVRASYKGWLYAIEHPEEAIQIILDKYNTQNLTKKHLEYEADQTIKLVTARLKDKKYFGSFNKEQWETMIKLMYDNKLIRKMVSYNDVVCDSIINEVIEGR